MCKGALEKDEKEKDERQQIMRDVNNSLKLIAEALAFQPGGKGFKETQTHFESISERDPTDLISSSEEWIPE